MNKLDRNSCTTQTHYKSTNFIKKLELAARKVANYLYPNHFTIYLFICLVTCQYTN